MAKSPSDIALVDVVPPAAASTNGDAAPIPMPTNDDAAPRATGPTAAAGGAPAAADGDPGSATAPAGADEPSAAAANAGNGAPGAGRPAPGKRPQPAPAQKAGAAVLAMKPQQASPGDSPVHEVGARRKQFIIAARAGANLNPMAVDMLHSQLDHLPDVKVVRRVRPSVVGTFGLGGGVAGDMIVAETTAERGLELQATAGPGLIVEENRELTHLALSPLDTAAAASAQPVTDSIRLQVTDDARQPLPRAQVILYGRNWPAQGETAGDGTASVDIRGGTAQSIQYMYVKPFANDWERWVTDPDLADGSINAVTLRPLASFDDAGFTPNAPFVGWGQRQMGLTTQTTLDGAGARIGIIDSGCDNQHPALTHVQKGLDYTNKDQNDDPDAQSWTTDQLGHGTHCAGVITGNGQNGIRGFAPKAEVHVLKLFPGGFFDDLSRGLKYAIDNKLDVVNCSLGSPEPSDAVRQWMNLARQAGVVVVVAAGNSAPDPVQFPANAPEALAVGAVGMQNTFPPDTYHAQTVPQGTVAVNGIFPARFSCAGPEVRIAGPGVAVISSVPGGGYAAWDGTSMAAPHITGLIALLAAHHPDFADRSAPRNAARVDRLISLAMGSAMPLGLDARQVGAGLPSLVTAMSPAMARPAAAAATPGASPADVNRIISLVMAQLAAQGAVPGQRPGA
ncbi:MAG TPA: S8 family serine peptidase [Devosia sp.]|nr:S8 family serine peptidase [Devosia sp.]